MRMWDADVNADIDMDMDMDIDMDCNVGMGVDMDVWFYVVLCRLEHIVHWSASSEKSESSSLPIFLSSIYHLSICLSSIYA